MPPLVSVIIPTKNSAGILEICLSSIVNQTYKNREIIVVDNFSTDETQKIARKYTDNVFEYGPERTFQKNHGLEKARGEYICFIDSDMELPSEILEKLVEMKSRDSLIGGISIPERSVGKSYFARVRDYERSFYGGTSIESARFFSTADAREVGGFETDIVFFEESLLPQKIEVQLEKSCQYTIDTPLLHHEGDISLRDWLKKKYYYAQSLPRYQKKVHQLGNSGYISKQLGILSRYMIFFGKRRFYKKPLLALSVLILKTLEFASAGFGLLSIIFTQKHVSPKA